MRHRDYEPPRDYRWNARVNVLVAGGIVAVIFWLIYRVSIIVINLLR